jgi:hypothetical protein
MASLRSRRQHKAWGVSPRSTTRSKRSSLRRSLSEKVPLGSFPFSILRIDQNAAHFAQFVSKTIWEAVTCYKHFAAPRLFPTDSGAGKTYLLEQAKRCHPFHGLTNFAADFLGLAPQALRCRLLRRLDGSDAREKVRAKSGRPGDQNWY